MANYGRYDWVDVEKVTTPPGRTVDIYRDCWWAVNAAGQVCLYRWGHNNRETTPQANTDRRIVERLMPPGSVSVILLPLAYVPHRCGR